MRSRRRRWRIASMTHAERSRVGNARSSSRGSRTLSVAMRVLRHTICHTRILMQTRQLLQNRVQRLRPILTVAGGLGGGEELVHKTRGRQRGVGFLGSLQNDLQVLLLK